jgi:hypothetical protein
MQFARSLKLKLSAKYIQVVLLVGWAALVGLGFVVLMGYQNAPGRPAAAPSEWPSTSVLQPHASQGTLIVFTHPHCPCTRATMGELERVLRYVQGDVKTYVVFVQPDGYTEEWVRSDLWKRTETLPAVTPVVDPGGVETDRFGAFTSGQVLYYDAERQLRFAGGITGSRGHEGDNKGRQALLQWIQRGAAPRTSTFVFGCALQQAPINAWKRFDFNGVSHGASRIEHHPVAPATARSTASASSFAEDSPVASE